MLERTYARIGGEQLKGVGCSGSWKACIYDGRIKLDILNLGMLANEVLQFKPGPQKPDRQTKIASAPSRSEVLIGVGSRHYQFQPWHKINVTEVIEPSLNLRRLYHGLRTKRHWICGCVFDKLSLNVSENGVQHIRDSDFLDSHG
jgi:hypothetical protein